MSVRPPTVNHMTRPWHAELAVFDLETTGIDVETSRIVTAHVGVLDAAGRVVEQWKWMADPGVEIPEGAAAIHGVTTEIARASGRPARQVVGEIVATLDVLLVSGLPLVIYNAPYDLSLLNREARRHRVRPLSDPRPVIDPLVLDKAVDRYRPGKRTLTRACEVYGVELLDAHDASADAIAAGRVAQELARRYDERLGDDPHDLHDRQVRWCKAQSLGFQDYMRRTKDPDFSCGFEWPERPHPSELALPAAEPALQPVASSAA